MVFNFNSKQYYQNFVKYLASNETEKVNFPEKHIKILNTNRKIYFLTAKQTKEIAKKIAKTDPEGYFKYVQNASLEEVLIWGLVITHLDSIERQIAELDKWKDIIDCWVLVDSLEMKKLKSSKLKSRAYLIIFIILIFLIILKSCATAKGNLWQDLVLLCS